MHNSFLVCTKVVQWNTELVENLVVGKCSTKSKFSTKSSFCRAKEPQIPHFFKLSIKSVSTKSVHHSIYNELSKCFKVWKKNKNYFQIGLQFPWQWFVGVLVFVESVFWCVKGGTLNWKTTNSFSTNFFSRSSWGLLRKCCHWLLSSKVSKYSLHWVLRLVPITGFEFAKPKSYR